MKINRLALKGFIGIKKGMGLDEIELDLSMLNGLIALSGKNGAGKTSVLESLTPYRTLASRKKALTAHCFMKDSKKELDFDFQGDSYQTRIKINADSGKQEGFIWQNGASLVNGSAREYDRKIAEIFGSKDLFFNSIFCAQNAQKLSDLTTSKLKELFSEFLQLNKYIAYENTVKKCLGALDAQLGAYERQTESLQEKIALLIGCEGQLEGTIKAQGEEKTRLQRVEIEIEANGKAIITLKERIAAMEAMEARSDDFRQRIYSTECALSDEKTAYEGRVGGIRSDLRKCKNDLSKIETILKMKDEIETAVSQKAEVETRIEAQTSKAENCQTELSEIREKIYQHDQTILPSIQSHKREMDIPILKERIINAEAKAVELEKRDQECTSSVCSFIVGALQAQESIDGLRKDLAALETEVAKHNEHVETVRKKAAEEKAEMQGIEKEVLLKMTLLKNRLSKAKVELAEHARRAEHHDDLKVAMAQKSAIEARASELTGQGMKEKRTFDAKTVKLQAEMSKFKASLEEITSKIDNSAKERLGELLGVNTNKINERTFLRDNINRLEAEIQQCRNDIEREKAYREQKAEIITKIETLKTQISEWTYLRNAVSKDGLRALEIDGVAPSISAYANQILFNTFGPAYSVKLRTQDDEGRETLDILALEEDGRETLLDDLSGGEKVWSLKALRLAMTLISKEKSGKAFFTAMADEEDGALDAGNSQNFVHMYRSFMETGGFDDCFFISHRPECVALSDHVLSFESGCININ